VVPHPDRHRLTAIFITYTVIMALHLGLNVLNVNLLAKLNTFSAWWHMIGVLVIVAVLVIVPDNHASVSFVFGETINNSGFSDNAFWFVFGIGPADGPVHDHRLRRLGAHERGDPPGLAHRRRRHGHGRRRLVVFGFALLVAITFAVPDVQGVTDAAGSAVVYIWTESLGEPLAEFLLFIAVVAQLFCGTASVTSASRMMFAFSRDGAVPGSAIWRKVSTNRVPVNAVIAICVLAWALMIPTLANGVVGYAVGTSIAVIGLYIAFALPIILRIRQGDRFERARGAWATTTSGSPRSPWPGSGWSACCSCCPSSPSGIPGPDFDWNLVNYARSRCSRPGPVRRWYFLSGEEVVHRPGARDRRRPHPHRWASPVTSPVTSPAGGSSTRLGKVVTLTLGEPAGCASTTAPSTPSSFAFTDMQGRLQGKRAPRRTSWTRSSRTTPRRATTCSPSTSR
jgi:hypothetical protein